ncbi:MAG TPA: peptidoglycan-associated lipoprotein Pal [Steroidobacteraceae bacterium]|nr:peptidoglycan-associated lipoprotein Pal [Steroidobacteraceae bacterium]
MKLIHAIAVTVLAVGLAACSTTKPAAKPAAPAAAAADSGAKTSGLGGESAGAGQSTAAALTPQQQALAALKEKSSVFFEFDSSEIKAEYQPVVAAHAAYLAKYPAAHVRLEGNTDERGTREYNIGLGERRAQAVRKALMLQGVGDKQITTVSYGAERPRAEGHDEAAWAQNRRVDLVQVP